MSVFASLKSTVERLKKIPRNIWVLATGWFFWSPVQAMAGPYMQLYLSALGAGPEDLSLVQSIQQYANAAARVVGGYLADRHGRKKVIWVGTALVSAAYVLMALAPEWRSYAFFSALNSLFLFYQPALESIQADSVLLEVRGRTYAFIQFLSGLASSLAPLGGAAVVTRLGVVDGVRLSFALSAAVGFGIAVLRAKLIEETLPPNPEGKGFLEAYREALSLARNGLAGLVVADVLLNFTGAMTFLGNYYMYYFLGVGEEYLGLLATLGGVASLLLTLPSGFVVDKYGRGFSLTLGYALGTLGLLLFTITPPNSGLTLTLLALSSLVSSVGGPLYGLAYSTLRADVVPKEHRGRVFALLGIPPTVAWSLGAMIGGWMYSALDPRAPFAASLALRLLLTPLLLALFKSMSRDVDVKLRDTR